MGEAADLIGVSSQAIRDAEKAGRLPHPDMEMRGRVEQRVGYTIEQINHMRDVFGTRLRRPDDSVPPVIAVAAHKGVSIRHLYLYIWHRTGAERAASTACRRERSQGTASMYHGWVPDLHIHAEDTLLPFILVSAMMQPMPSKPPAGRVSTSYLHAALHRIETELMGRFDNGKLPTEPHMMLRRPSKQWPMIMMSLLSTVHRTSVLVPSMSSVLQMYSSCQRQQSYLITPLPFSF